MQKLLKPLSAAALFTAATSLTYADVNDAQVRNLENRVSALEQRKGASGMINPSGRPEVKDGADLFITADFLIWQAHENGLGYVIKNTGPDLSDSSTKGLHFDWDPGVRVGLGWNTPHDGWDVYANWTWFYTKAHSNTYANASNTLYPALTAPSYFSGTSEPSSTSARWKLHLNMIDLELGREFFVSKWMTLRPFIGLRNAWINQRMHASYLVPGAVDVVHMKSKYWGIGARPGLNTQFGLGSGFSFFGNTAISLLYGFFDLDQDQYSLTPSGAETLFVDNAHSFRVGRAIAEIQLGIRWEHMFAKDRCHFSIQAGWENLMFFGQNQFDKFVDDTAPGLYVSNQGDLTIQGYTIALRLDF